MLFGSMYRSRSLLFVLALLLTSRIGAAAEVAAGSVLTLTFIEVRAETRGHAAGVLRKHANDAREHRASTGPMIVLQETSRVERFAVLERGTPTVSTTGGTEVHALRDGLADDLTAPPDRRLNREFDGDDTATGLQVDARATFYVVAHVDIATQDRSGVERALLKFAAAARRIDGNLGFEVLQQTDRPNHFNLVSAWLGESPYRTFVASTPAREFRQAIGQFLGSPYDERLFRQVD
jgi:quinol monooxygenase YgiN